MAPIVGTDTSYNLTVGIKLNIEDMIWLVSPFDVPLQGTNGADGRSAISTDTCDEVLVQWLDENLLTPRSTLAATAATADAFITVASGTSRNFQTGDTLLIDSEYLYVTGYGTTTDTLTVTRAWDGVSTAAQHIPLAPVVCTGAAIAEGSDAQAARSIDRNNRFNYTQIFGPYSATVSGTENAVAKYGLTGTEFDHQVANRTKELLIGIEQAIIMGTRVQNTGTSQRTMGGLVYYIQSNVDSVSTQLTDTTLLTQLQACFDAGGQPDRLMVGSKQKRNVSAINSSEIRYAQVTNARGQVVDYYDSDFGQISVVLNRWCTTNQAFLFSREQATLATLRPCQFEMLAKTGDAEKGMILAEKSFIFRREPWSARFSGLT